MTSLPIAIVSLLLACKEAPATRGPRPGEDPVEDSEDSEEQEPEFRDEDGDGFIAGQGDCDDQDPTVHRGATETVDGVDQDCDGRIDDGTEVYDDDGDGFSEADGDCDDTARTTSPNASDRYPCDGIDQRCTGLPEPCDSLDEAHTILYFTHPSSVLGDIDMTGDGRPDMVTTGQEMSILELQEQGGRYTPTDLVARVEFESPYTYGRPAALGDTNGDGWQEIVYSSDESASETGVKIFSAPIVGAFMAADLAVATVWGARSDGFGTNYDAGWDASGDGVADILIGAPDEATGAHYGYGSVYLVSGSVQGEVAVDDVTLARVQGEADGDYLGAGLRFSGDNDGDGVGDVLLGRWRAGDVPTRLSWFAGPLAGSLRMDEADLMLDDPTRTLDAWSFSSPGDWDGDGLHDVILSTWDSCVSHVSLYAGLPTEGLDSASARIDGVDRCADRSGVSFDLRTEMLMVDVNGDGLDDIVLGDPDAALGGFFDDTTCVDWNLYAGAVAVYVGPFSGVRDFWDAERIWAGESAAAILGNGLSTAGDLNDDGHEDFLMAAPRSGLDTDQWSESAGAAYLMLGSADW